MRGLARVEQQPVRCDTQQTDSTFCSAQRLDLRQAYADVLGFYIKKQDPARSTSQPDGSPHSAPLCAGGSRAAAPGGPQAAHHVLNQGDQLPGCGPLLGRQPAPLHEIRPAGCRLWWGLCITPSRGTWDGQGEAGVTHDLVQQGVQGLTLVRLFTRPQLPHDHLQQQQTGRA